jgi:hypothetical protein
MRTAAGRNPQRRCGYALGKMLAEAETAALMDRDVDATEHLRELQAHCEKLVEMLAPAQQGRPKLVVAA